MLSTWALVAFCLGLFAAGGWSACRLLGVKTAARCAAVALSIGWLAERMGSTRGWFFGRYHYTEVLGPEVGGVPIVIALMWFVLCWVGLVMGTLLLHGQPVVPWNRVGSSRWLTTWIAAMAVTAFDLGADPYFVYVLRAWIMNRTDGAWFGETLQGFVGWMSVSFAIVTLFQLLAAASPAAVSAQSRSERLAAAIPLLIYGSGLVFQLMFGWPLATRAVAFFAMGLPLTLAVVAWVRWTQPGDGSAHRPCTHAAD